MENLGASTGKRIAFWAVLLAVIGAAGIVVFKLATNEPGAAACHRLAELDRGDEVVDRLERFVESRIIEMRLTKAERARVMGDSARERCESALDMLDDTLPHGQFMRLVECIAEAKTARSAARCI